MSAFFPYLFKMWLSNTVHLLDMKIKNWNKTLNQFYKATDQGCFQGTLNNILRESLVKLALGTLAFCNYFLRNKLLIILAIYLFLFTYLICYLKVQTVP